MLRTFCCNFDARISARSMDSLKFLVFSVDSNVDSVGEPMQHCTVYYRGSRFPPIKNRQMGTIGFRFSVLIFDFLSRHEYSVLWSQKVQKSPYTVCIQVLSWQLSAVTSCYCGTRTVGIYMATGQPAINPCLTSGLASTLCLRRLTHLSQLQVW